MTSAAETRFAEGIVARADAAGEGADVVAPAVVAPAGEGAAVVAPAVVAPAIVAPGDRSTAAGLGGRALGVSGAPPRN